MRELSSSLDSLSSLCTEAGLRGQKAVRASENFTWNLRVLKGQLCLLTRTQEESNDIVAQVDYFPFLPQKFFEKNRPRQRCAR